MPQVGETRTNPNNPAETARWDGSTWVITTRGGAPTGQGRPRPDIGPNARELEDGTIVSTGRNGGVQIIRGSNTPRLGADSAPRIYMGFDGAVQSNADMRRMEEGSRQRSGGLAGQWNGEGSGNPLTDDRFASMIDGMDAGKAAPGMASDIAKAMGGDSYQNYVQANSAFEAATLPMLSGAAVVESEARRMVRAALPERGDSPQVLASKQRQREMMLNGLAALAGKPPPYPGVGSMLFGPQGEDGATPGTMGPATPTARRSAPPATSAQQRTILNSPNSLAAGMLGSSRGLGAVGAGISRTPAAPARPSAATPPVEMLREGVNTTFKNGGGTWTLRNGKPVRLR